MTRPAQTDTRQRAKTPTSALADSDLLQIQVPDSPADLFPIETVTPNTDASTATATATATSKSKVKRQSRFNIDTFITCTTYAGKYGAIATLAGVVGYAGYSIVAGVTGVMQSTVAAVGAVIPVIFMLGLVFFVYRFISRRGPITVNETSTSSAGSVMKTVLTPVTGKKNSDSSKVIAALPTQVIDGNTDVPQSHAKQWITKMRSRDTGQVHGAWRAGDDRCAVGWGLEVAHPDGWDESSTYQVDGIGYGGSSGYNHKAMGKLEKLYGKNFIKDVIRLNDKKRWSLRKIADHVETELARKGKI